MKLYWQKSQNSDPVKEEPKSMIIRLGTPNLCVISSMNSAAMAADVNEIGLTSIHLVNLSIVTKMWV